MEIMRFDLNSPTTLVIDDATAAQVAELFRVLSDASRVRIIATLAGGPAHVSALAEATGISESAVSHQLRLLRGMRLVRPRRDGRVVFYSLDDQHIISIFKQTLQHVEEPAPASRVRSKTIRAGRG